ncbi:MAG TPA: sensor histidine kinase [Solirubrobacter sp.]|nr:sensor histidine kinase [Solirubrobacter sp.]
MSPDALRSLALAAVSGERRPTPVAWRRALRTQLAAGAIATIASTVVWAALGGNDFWPRWVLFGFATAIALQIALRRALRHPAGRRRRFAVHVAIFSILMPVEIVVWLLSGLGFFWPVWPMLAFSLLLGAHGWLMSRLPPEREQELAERVDTLTRSRSGALDTQAAELRRIERDLHDGAQARLVAMGMSLGLAEQLLRSDPDGAAELIAEARTATVSALDDLRAVVRNIHPPVLADRGLVGAIEALALDLPVRIAVHADLSETPPAPVESALYFAVAECLANVAKHSRATHASVTLSRHDGQLRAIVSDDGVGGAARDRGSGTGLRGVASRLEAFDGTLELDSPTGGPTTVTIRVPCAS